MTKDNAKERLDKKVTEATEAEVDPDRHRMEEAILATLAKGGPDDPFAESFTLAYTAGTLIISRADLKVIGKAIYDAVCLQGAAADAILLRDKVRTAGGNINALAGILDGSKAVDADIALQYIEKLIRLDKYRALDDMGREYLKAVETIKKKGLEPDTAIPQIINYLSSLGEDLKVIKKYPVERDAAEGFLDILNARRTDGRDWLGLDCGFNHLNHILNGLTEGVIVLGGMPSCGKTTLAKQIADHVAEAEKVPVLFYSFEQSAEELRIKSLARLSSVDSRRIWKGRSGAAEWKEVKKAAEDYRQGPGPYLTIIEAGRKDTVEAIRAAALMAKRKAGDKKVLLILDYLQIIPAGEGTPDSLRERIDWNLSELRRLSRDLKSPVLIISSQNRESYRGNPKPTLAALKESGGIEYSADAVICLFRNEAESERLANFEQKAERIEAHVLKNRNGETGSKVKLDFTPAWSLFDESRE
jgi:replicative DNA helicase